MDVFWAALLGADHGHADFGCVVEQLRIFDAIAHTRPDARGGTAS